MGVADFVPLFCGELDLDGVRLAVGVAVGDGEGVRVPVGVTVSEAERVRVIVEVD